MYTIFSKVEHLKLLCYLYSFYANYTEPKRKYANVVMDESYRICPKFMVNME